MNKQASLIKALAAGISGTVVMTLFMMMGNLMGLEMNVPKMLASMFGGNLIIGWVMHFMIGSILGIGYEFFFINKIKINNPAFRGSVYGILPWLMAQIMVMPMMMMMNGMSYFDGFFSGSIMMASASLMAHLVFGFVVGFVTKADA
jgi:Family of unknown function (DUF6789)